MDLDWLRSNDRYLATSLTWLRMRLMLAIDTASGSSVSTVVPQPPQQRSRWWGAKPQPVVTPPPQRISPRAVEQAAAARAQAGAISPEPALHTVARLFGLSEFERDTLLLCAAMELDPALGGLCAQAHGNPGMAYPTLGLALSALPEPAWDIVAPHRGLRRWRLVEIVQGAGQPLVTATLRAQERIVNYLKGLNYLDDQLEPLVSPLGARGGPALPPSQLEAVSVLRDEWLNGGNAAVQLVGADEASKLLVAARAATEVGLVPYRLEASLLPTAPSELDELARLWRREAMLLPLALYVDAADLADEAGKFSPVKRFLSRVGGASVLVARESWPELGRRTVVVDVAPPTAGERAATWRAELGGGAPAEVVSELAGQFALDVGAISEIAAGGGGRNRLWRACLHGTRPRLDSLAQRLQPAVGWDDLVLPEEEMTVLRQIAAQVANRGTVYDEWGFGERIVRGLGVSVLFSGPSGVGKTMAAEVLAAELELDLYRIDLSAVVSKYIGETEKNLRRLFDAAETGGAILLFDESESLFGKRSEVKDAHDRYANVETGYLLQRMEAYHGLAVLTTNLRSALDVAFLRRLRFTVDFPFPGVEQRRELWRRAFPGHAPSSGLDFDRLSRLQASGGMVRNIALNAAFLAAGEGGVITMPLVLRAARTEFRKLEIPFQEKDFV
ncbi:ATP-binding protein [Allokutzneria albata]|uniref:ATPase family associated with various cellular activities (AAA) n=1 Tax=Allokutzneria albata TaxID=211114 RepID=A0A1G9QY62_ALLAB|nr:ATP-binding protein [Allokutzneria albata]SDM15914.1 ATPase family associated with various cellular activities (AAA) [Allokutzneria albata]